MKPEAKQNVIGLHRDQLGWNLQLWTDICQEKNYPTLTLFWKACLNQLAELPDLNVLIAPDQAESFFAELKRIADGAQSALALANLHQILLMLGFSGIEMTWGVVNAEAFSFHEDVSYPTVKLEDIYTKSRQTLVDSPKETKIWHKKIKAHELFWALHFMTTLNPMSNRQTGVNAELTQLVGLIDYLAMLEKLKKMQVDDPTHFPNYLTGYTNAQLAMTMASALHYRIFEAELKGELYIPETDTIYDLTFGNTAERLNQSFSYLLSLVRRPGYSENTLLIDISDIRPNNPKFDLKDLQNPSLLLKIFSPTLTQFKQMPKISRYINILRSRLNRAHLKEDPVLAGRRVLLQQVVGQLEMYYQKKMRLTIEQLEE